MNQIRLVLTDIDGTLVEPGHDTPSEKVQTAISEVQGSGNQITAATGRPFEMARPIFSKLGLRGLNIFDAGASIIDIQTGEIAWRKWLDSERIRKLALILLPHAIEVDFFPDYKQLPPERVSVSGLTEDAPYAWAFIRSESREQVIDRVTAISDLSIHIGPGVKDRPGILDIQITDINADKFHAVNALRDIVHSDKQHTLAIGDSSNDLPLFDNAGVKVAMGNASAELKERADFVVGTVEEDGFAEAMERFVLH